MAKKRSRKRLNPEERMKDAKRWLRGGVRVMALTDAYMRRYAVERWIAQQELMQAGYKEIVQIENYEREGIVWEFRVDGYTGELKPVPKGTKDHELHLY
jgi:hypothetical protein